MQPNTVTLPVDVANNGTTFDEIYSRYEEQQNRTVYIGAFHTPDSRDMLTLLRTMPTKNGNFKGVSKSTVKFTKDTVVSGVDGSTTLTAPIIIDVSFSIPVGTIAADVIKARQRVIALLDEDSFMDPLNIQLQI